MEFKPQRADQCPPVGCRRDADIAALREAGLPGLAYVWLVAALSAATKAFTYRAPCMRPDGPGVLAIFDVPDPGAAAAISGVVVASGALHHVGPNDGRRASDPAEETANE